MSPARTDRKPPSPRGRSRERLLEAATTLFARKGYDGVSVDAIVNEAGLNKRMVYHYFGSKEGLYVAVLGNAFDRIAGMEARIFDDNPPADVALERIVHGYFRFLLENPEFPALLSWENLQGGRHLGAFSFTKAPILDALGRVITQGIASGEIRPEIDRRHMLIHLIGICLIYFSNRHTLSRTVGLALDDPQVMREGIAQAVSLIKHGFFRRGDGAGKGESGVASGRRAGPE